MAQFFSFVLNWFGFKDQSKSGLNLVNHCVCPRTISLFKQKMPNKWDKQRRFVFQFPIKG